MHKNIRELKEQKTQSSTGCIKYNDGKTIENYFGDGTNTSERLVTTKGTNRSREIWKDQKY